MKSEGERCFRQRERKRRDSSISEARLDVNLSCKDAQMIFRQIDDKVRFEHESRPQPDSMAVWL